MERSGVRLWEEFHESMLIVRLSMLLFAALGIDFVHGIGILRSRAWFSLIA